MTTQCCVCKRVRCAGVWEPALPKLANAIASGKVQTTHTYCPACHEVAELELLKELFTNNDKRSNNNDTERATATEA